MDCGTVTHRTRCAAAAEKEPLRATIKSGRKRRCQNRGTGETVLEGRGSRQEKRKRKPPRSAVYVARRIAGGPRPE